MRAFRVLIASLLPNKGGKTTLITGIAYGLKEGGFKVGYFKPFSVYDWYLDYDAVITNTKYGTLFPSEIVRISESIGIKDPYELLNPISLLTVPVKPSAFIEAKVGTFLYEYFSDIFKRAIFCRFSYYKVNEILNILYYNEWLVKRNLAIFNPANAVEKVKKRASILYRLSDYRTLSQILLNEYSRSIKTVLEYLENRYRVIFIESYKDSAWPLPWDEEVNVVLVVTPGQVMVYDFKRFKAAVYLKYSGSLPLMHVVLKDIINMLTPLLVIETYPISKFEVPETISEKFSNVIQYLIKVIER